MAPRVRLAVGVLVRVEVLDHVGVAVRVLVEEGDTEAVEVGAPLCVGATVALVLAVVDWDAQVEAVEEGERVGWPRVGDELGVAEGEARALPVVGLAVRVMVGEGDARGEREVEADGEAEREAEAEAVEEAVRVAFAVTEAVRLPLAVLVPDDVGLPVLEAAMLGMDVPEEVVVADVWEVAVFKAVREAVVEGDPVDDDVAVVDAVAEELMVWDALLLALAVAEEDHVE